MAVRLFTALLVAVTLTACEPMGPLAGRALSGDVSEPPDTWSALDTAEVIQLETTGPYSVNIWGLGTDNHYYVAAANGAASGWARRIEQDPAVRLRIDDQVFELKAEMVSEQDERLLVAEGFKRKYDLDAEEDFPDAVVYRLVPR